MNKKAPNSSVRCGSCQLLQNCCSAKRSAQGTNHTVPAVRLVESCTHQQHCLHCNPCSEKATGMHSSTDNATGFSHNLLQFREANSIVWHSDWLRAVLFLCLYPIPSTPILSSQKKHRKMTDYFKW